MSNYHETILLVLLFRGQDESSTFGLPLWAAMKELTAFYKRLRPDVEFRQHYLSLHVPQIVAREEGEKALNCSVISDALQSEDFWHRARGGYKRCLDQQVLYAMVRDLLVSATCAEDVTRETRMLLVTDQEITPPKEWRYIIAGRAGDGVVVSIAPLNPVYWSERDPDRVATVKRRARSMCICVVGEALDFERCDNEHCFMFGNVDSVLRLDHMLMLGSEHDHPELTGYGFEPRPTMPMRVQPIEEIRSPEALP